MHHLSFILEAVLFVSETPLSLKEIQEVLERTDLKDQFQEPETLEKALNALKDRLNEPAYIYELREIAGGYQLLTKKEFAAYAKQTVLAKENKKMSKAALETLAIVAYRQPVAKSEIEFIRGVGCDYAMQKLLEKQLIEPAGRSDAPGKPLLYKTTPFFMEYFGLRSMEDLPKLKELKIDEEGKETEFQNPAALSTAASV